MVGGAAFAASLAVAACQNTPPPPPVAVVELGDKDCTEKVDLDVTTALTPEKKKKWIDHHFAFDETTACGEWDGELANFSVYELPELGPKHTLTIGGAKGGIRTLGARIIMLDADGQNIREFADEKYMNFKHTFGVQFRPREAEKFVLVLTDSALVGQEIQALEQTLTSATYYTGMPNGGSYQTYSGVDRARSRTFSHEGSLYIGIQAASGYIGLPD